MSDRLLRKAQEARERVHRARANVRFAVNQFGEALAKDAVKNAEIELGYLLHAIDMKEGN